MSYIQISEEGYKEFKSFLDNSCVVNFNLRISYMGKNCSGATFNLDTGTPTDEDIVEQVNEINFIMRKEVIDEFGGFIILSNAENNGQGLELKPVIAPQSSCSVCPGC